MWGSRGRRIALIVWAAFAFVTWNVVFDRQVDRSGALFTQEQIQRYQRGEPISSIEMAFRPRVRAAASVASLCGGSVLIAGILLTTLVERRHRHS